MAGAEPWPAPAHIRGLPLRVHVRGVSGERSGDGSKKLYAVDSPKRVVPRRQPDKLGRPGQREQKRRQREQQQDQAHRPARAAAAARHFSQLPSPDKKHEAKGARYVPVAIYKRQVQLPRGMLSLKIISALAKSDNDICIAQIFDPRLIRACS
jgi:hypothetical protein